MKARYSTREAAKKLGIALVTLQGHVAKKTFAAPPLVKVGGISVRLWADRDIQRARKVLAGIKPGRKRKSMHRVTS
jgi:hypothetical protein